MIGEASKLSLVASAIYLAIVAILTAAAINSRRSRQASWHSPSWIAIAVIFTLLAALRVFAVEDILRESLREMLRSHGAYDMRRQIQWPVLMLFGAVAGISGWWWMARKRARIRGRRDKAVTLAIAAAAGMLALVVVRIISYSPVDALLYGGLKLNWIADLGLSFLIAGAALYYIRLVRRASDVTGG